MNSNNIPILSTHTVSNYIHSVLSVPDISREEEIELFKKFREDGDKEAAQKLVISNLKLVVNLAYKFRRFRDVTDLIQEGNLGLLTALQKFDVEKGVRFATYATWWVKAKIQEFIISQMSIVRFGKSRDERKLFFNMMATIKDIQNYDNDGEITREELVQEVARRLDVTPEKVIEALQVVSSYNDISIDQTYEDGDMKLIELKDKTDYDHSIDEEAMNRKLQNALTTLNEREKFIIWNRYLADETLTLEEIGQKYEISKERVRQIEARALEKIKLFTNDNHLNNENFS
ncbi:MAG TPA: sigma-70 family RNA polymerase sigma factor [bacterium]|nr:sigma-70 family RNA polymerase sigma factor [bacterium]HPS29271.1 sigma-70 family RNA polymerase sigma factor [bacterium]